MDALVEAVVELTEQFAGQAAQRGVVPVAGGAALVVVGAGAGGSGQGAEGPPVAGVGQACAAAGGVQPVEQAGAGQFRRRGRCRGGREYGQRGLGGQVGEGGQRGREELPQQAAQPVGVLLTAQMRSWWARASTLTA